MRRSLGLPITMAVIMIVLVILLIVGWTIATIWAATLEPKAPTFFWALLPIGALSLTVILAGVIVYLVLSVKLINLNLRQSNFIDAVTHELKSPLASLKLQVQTLERLNIPEEKRQLIYQAMKNDVDRLEALINQVLMVSVLKSKPEKKYQAQHMQEKKLKKKVWIVPKLPARPLHMHVNMHSQGCFVLTMKKILMRQIMALRNLKTNPQARQ